MPDSFPVPPPALPPERFHATKFLLSVYLWMLFVMSCYNGCVNGERLKRVEDQNRDIRAILEERHPKEPPHPAPR